MRYIRFSGLSTWFSWGECAVISPLGFGVVPNTAMSIPCVSKGSYVARSDALSRQLGVLLAKVSTIPPSTPACSHSHLTFTFIFTFACIFYYLLLFSFSIVPRFPFLLPLFSFPA